MWLKTQNLPNDFGKKTGEIFMGGSGSGTWYRHSKKDTTNDYYHWNIRNLVKGGFLQEGIRRSGTTTWSTIRMGITQLGSSVSFTVNPLDNDNKYVQVQYSNSKTKEFFDYKISFTTTYPNYGGKRWWWICPITKCGRRVGVLYLTNKYFACRHCLNLSYESQNESPPFRFLTKAQNIHQKLGGNGCVDEWTPKPKGMHQKTYDRLVRKMRGCFNRSLQAMATRFRLSDEG